MKYRYLGKTGLQVSEIGFGAWAIGKTWWGKQEDKDSLEALHEALNLGVNFIDTAQVYGQGHSERLIGQVLRERKQLTEVIVATKVPPKNYEWPGNPQKPLSEAFPKGYVKESIEKSLKNLGRDYVDIYQLHVWTDAWIEDQQWYEAMVELREEGKIRFIGVSINDHAPQDALKLCRSGMVDTMQVIFNIFDQSPREALFPEAKRHGVGIIVRVPFDEGSLTGKFSLKTTFPEGDFRARYFRGERLAETVERVEKIKQLLLKSPEESLAPYALRFCLEEPAVSTIIPGMRNRKQARENCTAPYTVSLSSAQLEKLSTCAWIRNFYS